MHKFVSHTSYIFINLNASQFCCNNVTVSKRMLGVVYFLFQHFFCYFQTNGLTIFVLGSIKVENNHIMAIMHIFLPKIGLFFIFYQIKVLWNVYLFSRFNVISFLPITVNCIECSFIFLILSSSLFLALPPFHTLLMFNTLFHFSCLPVIFETVITFVSTFNFSHRTECFSIRIFFPLSRCHIDHLCFSWFLSPLSAHLHARNIYFAHVFKLYLMLGFSTINHYLGLTKLQFFVKTYIMKQQKVNRSAEDQIQKPSKACVQCECIDTTENPVKNMGQWEICLECIDWETERLEDIKTNGVQKSISIDKIDEGLYLGNEDAAYDWNTIQKHQIRAICVCGNYLLSPFESIKKESQPIDIKYKKYKIADYYTQQIINMFDANNEWIDEMRKQGRTVLVHCAAGVSRSASFVIAYIMKKKSLNFKKAYAYVKQKRSVIFPNQGFVEQLKQYQKMVVNK